MNQPNKPNQSGNQGNQNQPNRPQQGQTGQSMDPNRKGMGGYNTPGQGSHSEHSGQSAPSEKR